MKIVKYKPEVHFQSINKMLEASFEDVTICCHNLVGIDDAGCSETEAGTVPATITHSAANSLLRSASKTGRQLYWLNQKIRLLEKLKCVEDEVFAARS